MKKLVLLIVIIILASVNLLACSDSKDVEGKDITYTIKKDKALKVGEDLPVGTYILKANEECVAVNVTNKDGSSLISQFVANNDGEKFIEYNVKLPKDTTIIIDTDATLTKK